ncbi:hypothetical protein CsatA_010864 [Cannabis sativa]
MNKYISSIRDESLETVQSIKFWGRSDHLLLSLIIGRRQRLAILFTDEDLIIDIQCFIVHGRKRRSEGGGLESLAQHNFSAKNIETTEERIHCG